MDLQRTVSVVQELFHQAMDLPAEARGSFLDARCADSGMRSAIETLIRHCEQAADGFLAGDGVGTRSGSTPQLLRTILHQTGDAIGPYKLLSVIGEGGMGVVYEAEEDHPRRRVALKVIRGGLATHSSVRRFEYEVEVLARLEHPGIARVYRAGLADAGRGPQPYFAMELVRGQRLDEYVRDAKPSLEARLRLLVEICNAVHHAHTKGVIHRDLKPSNILIAEQRQPKILDFGVARATDSDIPQTATLNTQSGQIIGTLPYMAPEQAAGRVHDLDTSSDVYALGVIAFELLGSAKPYSLEDRPLHEAVRIICETEPPRLSTLDRSLRGDVETIVGKALEKDKTRRYRTAGELAADVQRYLDDEPIAARAPSAAYHLRKFARRNKLLVAAALAVAMALAAGTVTSTLFALHAQRQRRRAEQSQSVAQATVKFLTDDVLSGARPDRLRDKTIRDAIVRVMLDPVANTIGKRFADQPLVQAAVLTTLATCYDALGRADLGLQYAEKAKDICRSTLGDDDPETLTMLSNYGSLLHNVGRLSEAEPRLREVLERRRARLGNTHPDTLSAADNLGYLLAAESKFVEAETFCREAVAGCPAAFGEDHPETFRALTNLAYVLAPRGQLEEAESLLRRALQGYRNRFGDDHPDTVRAISNLAAILQERSNLRDAEPLCREALKWRRQVLGDGHPDTLLSMDNLGYLLTMKGQFAEARPLLQEALRGLRTVQGNEHAETLRALHNLAVLLALDGHLDQAEPLMREEYETCERRLGPNKFATMTALNNLGYVLLQLNRLDEAEPRIRDALRRRHDALGADHLDTLVSTGNLCELLEAQSKLADAESIAAELYQRTIKEADAGRIPASQAAPLIARYGLCLTELGKYEQADAPLRDAFQRDSSAESDVMRSVIAALAEVCRHTGRPDEARGWESELAQRRASTRASTGPSTQP